MLQLCKKSHDGVLTPTERLTTPKVEANHILPVKNLHHCTIVNQSDLQQRDSHLKATELSEDGKSQF